MAAKGSHGNNSNNNPHGGGRGGHGGFGLGQKGGRGGTVVLLQASSASFATRKDILSYAATRGLMPHLSGHHRRVHPQQPVRMVLMRIGT
jgi:hypothetical protein